MIASGNRVGDGQRAQGVDALVHTGRRGQGKPHVGRLRQGVCRDERRVGARRKGEEKEKKREEKRRKGSDPVGGVGVVEFRFDSERASLRPKNRLIAA